MHSSFGVYLYDWMCFTIHAFEYSSSRDGNARIGKSTIDYALFYQSNLHNPRYDFSKSVNRTLSIAIYSFPLQIRAAVVINGCIVIAHL